MKDINKLNKRDVENEIINEFSISLMLISKTLFERYIKIEMIIRLEIIDAVTAKNICFFIIGNIIKLFLAPTNCMVLILSLFEYSDRRMVLLINISDININKQPRITVIFFSFSKFELIKNLMLAHDRQLLSRDR